MREQYAPHRGYEESQKGQHARQAGNGSGKAHPVHIPQVHERERDRQHRGKRDDVADEIGFEVAQRDQQIPEKPEKSRQYRG